MSIPDFTRADYGDSPALVEPPPALPLDRAAYPRAVSYGLIAAILGAIPYAIIGIWINFGFFAIILGGMVGTAMMNGSRGIGGRKYQVTAVIITYFAVTFASVLDQLWQVSRHGADLATWIPKNLIGIAVDLLIDPFLQLQNIGYGLIGLIVLFFGMQAAWRTAKGGPGFYRLPGYDKNSPLGLR